MYDDFSTSYDRFVDWESRLAAELPFLERRIQAASAHRLLDAGCGTGKHAIALAEKGYDVVGTDISSGMIQEARRNAAGAGVDVRFEVAPFGELAAKLAARRRFDAVLCLGNSLPHLLTPADLARGLGDFGACMRPGATLLIQNRNFDAVLGKRDRGAGRQDGRWMDPQAHREGDEEWVFIRFYDFEANGLLTFNLVTLRRQGQEAWTQRVTATRLWPLTQAELTQALDSAGFETITLYGDLHGNPFEADGSPNLVVEARWPG